MKHYCNRQTGCSNGAKSPKNGDAKVEKVKNSEINANSAKVENRCRANQKAAENSERLKAEDTDDNDDVVFPPGSACAYLSDSGVSVRVMENTDADPSNDSGNITNLGDRDYGDGKGGAFSQLNTYRRRLRETDKTGALSLPSDKTDNIIAHNMSGRFNFLSVPHDESGVLSQTMPVYLKNYLGKYICLDLWTCERMRIEKCGVLTDVGADFIAIKNTQSGNRTVIDLRTIRYVSIFCR